MDESELMRKLRTRRSLPVVELRKLIRKRAGATQQDCADVIGVSRVAVSRWENGERTPRGAQLDAYVALLDKLARSLR